MQSNTNKKVDTIKMVNDLTKNPTVVKTTGLLKPPATPSRGPRSIGQQQR